MDENPNNNESLTARIQQLEHERDELRKDIEQLCIQQAGSSYLVVATRMHFQRTAGLEQEIEKLKMSLAACTRENINLQEELSEAYHIKGQLADLHDKEVSKNIEAEKQIKFFQGCVASAFAERDHSLMEAEKAKEKEELMLQNLNDLQNRVEELVGDCLEEKKHSAMLQFDLAKQEEQNNIFMKVVDKFYQIRHHYFEGYDYETTSWDDKCACLLHDAVEQWSFNDHGEASTSKYISALEEELETLRKSMDKLQYKLRVGLDIENHLKKRVSELEKKQICFEEKVKGWISELLHSHTQHRVHIAQLLDEGKSEIQSTIDTIEEKVEQHYASRLQNLEHSQRVLVENECRDVHISPDAESNLSAERNSSGSPTTMAGEKPDASEALALALQEKVATLLLLSQQDERHLLERNVNAALQSKAEELQRNLLQVSSEKVKALMELAQLKLEYQQLQEKVGHEMKRGNLLADTKDKRIVTRERDGRLKSLLKKTYLRHWVGKLDFNGSETEVHLEGEGNVSNGRSSHSMDFARMKIENAGLRESMECMEHLTSSTQRLRLSLLKAKESITSEGTISSVSEALDNIITEAKLVKTALGSSLPVSWSAEVAVGSSGQSNAFEPSDVLEDFTDEKIDSVSAAGFEMVELLMLAAQMLKDNLRGSSDVS